MEWMNMAGTYPEWSGDQHHPPLLPDYPLVEVCVLFLSLFHGHGHLVLLNSIINNKDQAKISFTNIFVRSQKHYLHFCCFLVQNCVELQGISFLWPNVFHRETAFFEFSVQYFFKVIYFLEKYGHYY